MLRPLVCYQLSCRALFSLVCQSLVSSSTIDSSVVWLCAPLFFNFYAITATCAVLQVLRPERPMVCSVGRCALRTDKHYAKISRSLLHHGKLKWCYKLPIF